MDEALRQPEARNQPVFESAFEVIFHLDKDGRLLDINRRAETLTGYSRIELLEMNVLQALVIPEDRPVIQQVLHDVARGRERVYEVRWRAKDGRTIHFEGVTTSIRSPDGEFVSTHCTLRDITERKQIEAALQRATERLKTLHAIDRAILGAQSPEEIAHAAVDHLRRMAPYQRASIGLFAFEAGKTTVFAVSGMEGAAIAPGRHLVLPNPSVLDQLRQGQARLVEDVEALARPSAFDEILKAEGIRSFINVPIIVQGELIGTLNLGADRPGAFREEHVVIAREVADSLAVALQNARLLESVSKHRRDLQRLSAQLLDAQEVERKHIASELHDEIGQALTAISFNLAAMEETLPAGGASGIRERLADTTTLVEQVLEQVRSLSFSLRPAMLDEIGLVPGVRWYVHQYSKRLNIAVEFEAHGFGGRLPAEMETALYRVIQEALTNVARHAHAGRVRLRLEQTASAVSANIEDDGRGFDPAAVAAVGIASRGVGLLGIQERAAALGGSVLIQSAPGQGTRLRVELPWEGGA